MKHNTTEGVQDALIPDEITPLMLLDLDPKIGAIKKTIVAYRKAVANLLPYASRDEYLAKYHNIDPHTEALYDTDDIAKRLFDAANAMDKLICYPIDSRKEIVAKDIERSLEDPFKDLPTTGVDPDTGEIK